MSKGIKRGIPALLAIILLMGILAACTNAGGDATNEPSAEGTETEGAAKEFRFTIGSEPPSLDPGIMTDAQSAIVASGLFEGLMRLNEAGEPENALATDWKVSDDGKTYTFTLRQDAKWSNGDPVTAHDFEYAWKRALAPETASDYAYILYYLENGAAYNEGTATADQVGVKALDDYTLEAKLTTPAPYFVSLVSHYTYWPVHQATVEADEAWATDKDTLVTNGPFLLTEWQHGGRLVLTKNPDYYDKDQVHFDRATISIVEDDSTVFNLFETDKIDWIGAQAGSVPTDRVEQVIADGSAEVKPVSSVYYYFYNTTKPPFNNAKMRKAFAMAIDRQAIIDNVTKANQTPAFGLVPPSTAGEDGKLFREMYPDTGYFTENLEEAKKLMAEGMAELKLTELPPMTLLYNTNEGHKAIAEAVADMWRTNLGVEVKLGNQEWGTFLETRKAQQFDVARAGWGADFNHAINFTYDLIYSTSGNNDGKYSNPQVDKLLDEAIMASNEAERLEKIAQAEKIAFADDMGALPIYYYTTVTMQKPGFVNVVSDYAGHLQWAFGDKQ